MRCINTSYQNNPEHQCHIRAVNLLIAWINFNSIDSSFPAATRNPIELHNHPINPLHEKIFLLNGGISCLTRLRTRWWDGSDKKKQKKVWKVWEIHPRQERPFYQSLHALGHQFTTHPSHYNINFNIFLGLAILGANMGPCLFSVLF